MRNHLPLVLTLLYLATPASNSRAQTADDAIRAATDEAHAALFVDDRFPSAQACRTCHPEHYDEWSISQHAYAQLSPVFNSMQAKVTRLTNGTNGDFCIRCHTPVGMILKEPVFISNLERHPVSREGVTCVACHRVNSAYGKISGRIALVEGDVTTPVRGPIGNAELMRVLADPQRFKVVTDKDAQGRKIHADVVPFFALTNPGFCGSCHDVNLVNGFRLEEAFSEYKSSPAAQRGVTCQDCHMGTEPGIASGYREGPAAVVGGVPTRPRRRADHTFPGPDYSVIHPGMFPHNPDAEKLASLAEWLQFDVEAGWGTDAFEQAVADDAAFPDRWRDAEDRFDAREIIEHQLERLQQVAAARAQLLRVGYRLGEVEAKLDGDLKLSAEVRNGTDGHNVPTGFTAERIVFLRITVTDADGAVLYRSGDLDPRGDLRDSHSSYVHDGKLPLDRDLFSLQSRFITRNLFGGEREQILAVNQSLDALPFVRPEIRSTVLLGRPLDARIHKMGIEPGGARTARYRVAKSALSGRVPYRIEVQLIAGMVPVNLVYEVQDVGFDYGLTAPEIARRVVDGHIVLWERELIVGGMPLAALQSEVEETP